MQNTKRSVKINTRIDYTDASDGKIKNNI